MKILPFFCASCVLCTALVIRSFVETSKTSARAEIPNPAQRSLNSESQQGSLPLNVDSRIFNKPRDISAVIRNIALSQAKTPHMSSQMDLVEWARKASKAELIAVVKDSQTVPTNGHFRELIDCVIFARLGEIDGEAAQLLMYQLPNGRKLSERTKHSFFATWVKANPLGAVDGVLAQLEVDSDEMKETVAAMIETLRMDDMELALSLASEMAHSKNESTKAMGYEGHAAIMRTRQKFSGDISTTISWIESIKASEDERLYLMRSLVSDSLEVSDTAGALHVYRLLPPDEQEQLSIKMVDALSDSQPQEAKILALSLRSGSARALALEALVENLSSKGSSLETLNWLSIQPQSTDFDASFQKVAKDLAENYPEEAYVSISFVSDPAHRKRLQSAYGFKWLQKDYLDAAPKLAPRLVSQYDQIMALASQIRSINPDYHGTLEF